MSIVRMPWSKALRMTGMTGRVSASWLSWCDHAAPPITMGVISEARSPRGRRVGLAICFFTRSFVDARALQLIVVLASLVLLPRYESGLFLDSILLLPQVWYDRRRFWSQQQRTRKERGESILEGGMEDVGGV